VSEILAIPNHGPLIVASNYWQSGIAARGLLYLSVNGGAFRLLVPELSAPDYQRYSRWLQIYSCIDVAKRKIA
jgi:hypothetical protein